MYCIFEGYVRTVTSFSVRKQELAASMHSRNAVGAVGGAPLTPFMNTVFPVIEAPVLH